jgi:hypothetical protein
MARILRGLILAALLALLAAPALAEVSGTWHATVEGDMGPVELTFTFRRDGERVTGSVSVGTTEAEITDGRISGDRFTFNLPWGDAPQVLISYEATVDDGEMEIVSTFTRPDGEPVVTEFTAKRAR